uniref:ATP-dependent helicase HrpA n=1 Tax=Candidatus Kentrum sp. MB TaxID=2138164 RepID=A0A451B8V5_9GAMM|nr:MAG: ATP-dependent helicase HrpA [Candidatus Kentron sp. MB]VFK74733.1 MAG: ATP-dependent helicase HrpA [Candidatus Kentron sp. MB]
MPNTLPIDAHRDEIIRTVDAHQVTVIHGDTGSGKSTQLPKFCLAMGRGEGKLIGHTQPRRVAARSVAARIAAELEEELGHTVGYQIRFMARTGPQTRIKLMTDGILLAEIRGDRNLRVYDTLIIDEAHERSLDTDFILGYLKKLLPRRPELKLILASATIDPIRFSRHFDNAPVITVSGRMFPVEVRYRSLEREENTEEEAPARKSARNRSNLSIPIPDAVAEAVAELDRAHRKPEARDILVFLSGEQEIRETAEALRKRRLPNTDILPLFGRLSAHLQDRIFAPHTRRHIVLATNIAETSLTVPGIGFVIDAGYARISRYNYRSKVQRLPVEPISQASADQRKGRCGRIAPGVCIRLYTREEFEARPLFTPPEILRTNLATVILRMKSLGFGNVERFPFPDMPDRHYISDGHRLLRELGAMDDKENLTKRGRQLARLPVDPRIGRMILAGAEERCLDEVLIIAAALSIPDPRENFLEGKGGDGDTPGKARARFQDGRSDFMELLRIWAFYQEKREQLSSNQLQKRCRSYSLSYLRMREWREVHQQLRIQAREMKLPANKEPATYARIHRALLTGLLGYIGFNTEEQIYTGARNTRFLIGRESSLHGSRAKWIMAAELVQTARTYAHNVARIRAEWIERAGRDLLKTDYFDAHWDPMRREVMIYERLTLYGLTIISQRKIPYGAINPHDARDLFIEAALVDTCCPGRVADSDGMGTGAGVGAGDGEIDAKERVSKGSEANDRDNGLGKVPFFVSNRALLSQLQEWEHRTRRPGAFLDEATLKHFYVERIPESIASIRAFEAWRHRAERADPKLLFLAPRDLCDPQILLGLRDRFPDKIVVLGQHLRLEYRFQPSDDARDGVTVTIPQSALYPLDPAPFQWLVPGLLEEKILALLRTLPKPLRRALPPLADTARACFLDTPFGRENGQESSGNSTKGVCHYPEESLLALLGARLRREANITISSDAWREQHIAPHLRMNFRIIDGDGATLRMGRDLEQLRRELLVETSRILPKQVHRPQGHRQSASAQHQQFHRDGITEWDFPDLPPSVDITAHGSRFQAYPALIDRGDSVSLRLVDSPLDAVELTCAGLCRLFLLGLGRELRYLRKNLPGLQVLCITYAALPQAPSGTRNPGSGITHGIKSPGIKTNACEELREHLVESIVQQTFLDDKAPIQTRAGFLAAREQHAGRLLTITNDICQTVGDALKEYRAIASLRQSIPSAFSDSLQDIRDQLDQLLFRGFVRATPVHHLTHLSRYLKAIGRRLQKLPLAPDKDRRNMEELAPLYRAHAALAAADTGSNRRDLERLRWLLEELRVSLFAQELGTTQPVSTKRVQKQLEKLRG